MSMHKLNKTERVKEFAKFLTLAIITASVLLFVRFASAAQANLFPPCLFHSLTKIYCPGCGISRALVAIVNFDFLRAFIYNPFLFIIIIPLFVYLSYIYLLRAVCGKRLPSILSTPKAVMPVAVTITVLWIVRNIFPPT